MSRPIAFVLILVAAVTWGTTGSTMKLVARHSPMTPLMVGFFRVALAAPALALAAGAFATNPLRPLRVVGRADRRRLLAAGLAMGVYQACYFWGVAKTSVAVGSLITICSAPLFITLLAAWLLGERITPTTAAALLTGTTGAALLTLGAHGVSALPPGFLAGAGLALGAGFSYAAFAVSIKGLETPVHAVTAAAWTFTVAALFLAPVLLVERPRGAPLAWAWLAYLGLVPTALAYVLYNAGLRTTPVTVSGVLTLLEPLTATTLGVLFFGDRLGVRGFAGAALLLGAVAVLSRAGAGRDARALRPGEPAARRPPGDRADRGSP